MRKKTILLIQKMIDESRIKYCSCGECGLVFSNVKFCKLHQEQTGHKNPTLTGLFSKGMDAIFEKAANVPRKTYYQDAVKEEQKEPVMTIYRKPNWREKKEYWWIEHTEIDSEKKKRTSYERGGKNGK